MPNLEDISLLNEKLKSGEEVTLFTFSHGDKNFAVTLNKLEIKSEKDGQFKLSLMIRSEEGDKLGVISGNFDRDNKVFVAHSAVNIGFDRDVDHVPGLVRETFAQLIDSKLFSILYSGMHNTAGGEKMFQRLADDPRLDVVKSSEYDGYERYKITRRR